MASPNNSSCCILIDSHHADVGGGAVANNNNKASKRSRQASLADISLRWMVREVMHTNCGIQFDTGMMPDFDVNPDLPLEQHSPASLHNANASTCCPPTTGPENQPKPSKMDKDSDHNAASLAIHDQLVLMPVWWILEVIPMTFAWQDRKQNGKWQSKRRLHLGRGRYSNYAVTPTESSNSTNPEPKPKPTIYFHKTVEIRMKNSKLGYTPKLKYKPENVVCLVSVSWMLFRNGCLRSIFFM